MPVSLGAIGTSSIGSTGKTSRGCLVREGPSADALASIASWRPMVSSWLGSEVLADDIPVIGGRATWTVSQAVPSSLSLTVPVESVEAGRRVSWRPHGPGDALGRFGQSLDVSILSEGSLTRLGRFQIQEWSGDEEVQVAAAGMLQRVLDDRFLAPTGPRAGGTLLSELARLLPDGMTVTVDGALVDRVCPRAMEWDEDRLEAVYDIVDAWPARLREDSWGNLRVLPPLPEVPSPVVTFTDGEGGTLISAPTSDSREGAPNIFVARSSADGVEAQAEVAIEDGPMAASGPYGRVPTFFSSPLLLTVEQCWRAARTRMLSSQRQSRIRQVSCAPDPRIELDDPVELVTGAGTADEVREWGYVVGVDLPLTIADGAMQLDVAVM